MDRSHEWANKVGLPQFKYKKQKGRKKNHQEQI